MLDDINYSIVLVWPEWVSSRGVLLHIQLRWWYFSLLQLKNHFAEQPTVNHKIIMVQHLHAGMRYLFWCCNNYQEFYFCDVSNYSGFHLQSNLPTQAHGEGYPDKQAEKTIKSDQPKWVWLKAVDGGIYLLFNSLAVLKQLLLILRWLKPKLSTFSKWIL